MGFLINLLQVNFINLNKHFMENNNNSSCCNFCGHGPRKFIIGLLGLFLIFFLAVKIVKDIKAYDYIGKDPSSPNTISVSGKGEIIAKANIATFTFSVTEESANVSDAQNRAAKKINDAINFLKSNGIEEKDIKTTNYNIYPRYNYVKPINEKSVMIPMRDNRVLIGYEVNQGIEVKVRKIDSAGTILSGVGNLGASNVSGLSFSIDEEDKLKKEARNLAIEDAKEEAKILAKGLGVKLVRIINFSESGYFPIYREKFSADTMAVGMGGDIAPEIPAGENKVTSQVNIVYEIR